MSDLSSETATTAPAAEASPDLMLAVRAVARVNFASAQNEVAVIRELALRNLSNAPLEGLTLTLTAEPPVLRPRTWTIDRLAPGTQLSLEDLATPLDISRLARLNEAERGELVFELSDANGPLLEERRRLDLLARDEWGGLGDMAQLLAAFVPPNDPAVAALLKEASSLLEQAGHDCALDGYQANDPQRVWLLAGAIWSAATGLGLSYAVPPASFEDSGQKVRGPTRIRAEGLATCLDSTLLLAAACEAAGLNPVVLFARGHAWLGVWLVPRDFGYVTEPDVVTVRKAVQARELVPLETTLLTKRPTIGFAQAVEEGRRRLAEDREHEFLLAVDIARARAARIRPLASQVEEGEDTTEHPPAAPAPLPQPLAAGELPEQLMETPPETAMGRIERWQRKLLDLSLRNRLLNFKPTKQTLPLLCPQVAELEDALASGGRFKMYSLVDDDPIGERQLTPAERRQIEEAAARAAFARGQIAVPLAGKEMNARLLELFRRARSDLQEGGTNTLFLAAGFLRWQKREGDPRAYRAPLLLIPVKLERRSAQSDFSLLHHEDDARFNATLLEFLKRDFELRIPELEGELPRDGSGIDVGRILQIMRAKVREVSGFEVVDELALSTFSFAKYLMWKDLVDRTDQLRENRLVHHLVDSPTEPFASDAGPALRPQELDRRIQPGEMVTLLPADSSQLAAVVAAAAGRDFVLIGPPGTGKSQTIANVISQCLASGKTVLFVAEKAAALDVVHRRLAAHGLGDAVLELHSNKTDRKAVVAQLGRSWDRAVQADGQQWVQVTEELRLTRDLLNAYVEALHAKGTQGFSIFEAIGWIAAEPEGAQIAFAHKDAHDQLSFERLIKLASELGRTHAVVKEGPPLTAVVSVDWSFAWENSLLQAARELRQAVTAALAASTAAGDCLGLTPDEQGESTRRALLDALTSRVAPTARDVSAVPVLEATALREHLAAFEDDLTALNKAAGSTAARYPEAALGHIPLEDLDRQWREAGATFWPFSALARRRVRKLLQSYAESGAADPARDLGALLFMRSYWQRLGDNPLAPLTGENRNVEQARSLVEQAVALRRALAEAQAVCADHARFEAASSELARGPAGELRAALEDYRAASETLAHAVKAFESAGGQVPPDEPLRAVDAALATVLENKARLSDWTRWMQARTQAEAAGLEALVAALEAGQEGEDAATYLRQAYARWWLPLALDASEPLRRFAHWDHERMIATFRQLDEQALRLAPTEVLRRLQHGLPPRDGAPRNSELGVLRHQLGLQRPSLPTRELLAKMPETFPKLAPCVLMSPLSVAQYLPPGQSAFDVVIFDEASQIFTWDAIGAIARGRQAIIVGDPKQLPPTNFFGRNDEDEEEDIPDFERDLPSILDEVCVAGIPTHRLDWHYRSRDEALIAFSNHFYYDGGLVTFPAPATGSQALRFHKIDGTYARGGGRINQQEAKAMVALIGERLNAWLSLPEAQRPTLGVITFNIQQQSLVLDLLDELRRAQPALEWFFAEDRAEPVIVKNLENIQGDERDVMLFSITFAPDAAGKFSMNFGALNLAGGEKRLNVAITRARQELHVFASITADQIDLSRTNAIGVRDLKAFLDYAERGAVALPARDQGSLGPAESPFEEAVAAAFCEKGWEVRTQIGVSGFRIDLGVVNPDRAGAYLAGIECDGAQYHCSATARDRDKVRQAVLEGLGWNILRIWSTDWYRNPAAVTERVHAQLEALLAADRESSKAAQEPEVAPVPQAEAEPESEPEQILASVAEAEADANVADLEPDSGAAPDAPLPDAQPQFASADAGASEPDADPGHTDYDATHFYKADYTPRLVALIEQIVRDQGPLPLPRLTRLVAARHGWLRAGRRIAERVEGCLTTVEVHEEFDVRFVWPATGHSERIPYRGLGERNLREISRAEIAWVMDQHAAALAKATDPLPELARRLGVARLSKDARSYLQACAQWHKETTAPK